MGSVCVFCGALESPRLEYHEAAQQLGKNLAEHSVNIVYGGGNIGMMGDFAHSAIAAGGAVTAVVPIYLYKGEGSIKGFKALKIVNNMFERKDYMIQNSDAFVVLPGGFGTLDEITEIIVGVQVKQIEKPLILIDTIGFWQPFIALADHFVAQGLAKPHLREMIIVVKDAGEAILALQRLNII